ncbi:MAG: mammalian cell entry protein [Caldimonas sp.]
MSEPVAPIAEPPVSTPVPHLALKATALLVLMLVLVCGAALYVMAARGVFEATQQLVLIAEDSEGVVAGMDLTFSGFPIGRVRRVELGEDGNARILVDVPRDDAHWLRTSSVFTLVRSLVGGTNLRAFSGILTDPPLPDGAVRTVLRGDATAEIPRLVASAHELLQNLTEMTAASSPLNESLGGVQSLTDKLKGPGGALGVLLGGDAERQKVLVTLDRTNALLARLDGLAAKTDTQVFGSAGVMPEARATVVELRGLLGDARASLKKVDAVLQEAQAVGANARAATTDLGALRSEVDASLRKVEQLINEVNRKWPFARDTTIKLP